MTTDIIPRPYSFKVLVDNNWVTFTEGRTDIPTILTGVWHQAINLKLQIIILDGRRANLQF